MSGVDAAHHVMHDGPHGDRFVDRIDANVVPGELTHEGEFPIDPLLAEMAQVKVDVGAVGTVENVALLLLFDERLGETVARAELHGPLLGVSGIGNVERLAEVVVPQIAVAMLIDQDAALAAGGFGHEDAGAGQAGGVVLDELHVLEGHAGEVGHGEAIAGLDGGVGSEGEDASGAARAEDDGLSEDRPELAAAELQRGHALAVALVDQEAGGEPLVVADDAGVLERGLKEGVEHVEAGLIGGVPGALKAHPAEGTHGHAAVRLSAPTAAPVLQLDQFLGRFLHEGLDSVLIAEPVAAGDRVVDVVLQRVSVLDHGGGAAFRGDGVAAHGVDLGDDGDVEVWVGLGDGDGGAQTGAAAANDHNIVLNGIGHRLRLAPRADGSRHLSTAPISGPRAA